jgi:hypothetical protein
VALLQLRGLLEAADEAAAATQPAFETPFGFRNRGSGFLLGATWHGRGHSLDLAHRLTSCCGSAFLVVLLGGHEVGLDILA